MNMKLWPRFLIVALILALSAAPASAQAGAQATPPVVQKTQGKLTHRLAALAASAELRGAGTAIQARALSLPESGPGSLMRSGSQVLVNVHLNNLSPDSIQALTAAGARVTFVSPEYQTAVAYIDPTSLATVASLPNVVGLEEEFTPQTGNWGLAPANPASANAPAASCPQGINVSEGDVQLKANQARATYSLNGSGVKVGILSDSYNTAPYVSTTAADDILSGDLPGTANPCGAITKVNVLSDYTIPPTGNRSSDEGRGMLQIVHDIAPQAQLSFATAFDGLLIFADNIRKLRNMAGADIIADDVFYFKEPFFQEGPVNVAIADISQKGAIYFALAGNHNLIVGGHDISSYEAPAYRPTTCPSILRTEVVDCHNFATTGAADAQESITLAAGGALNVDFQWAEPWYGVTTDLDIFLIDGGGSVVAWSNDVNTKASLQTPFELMYFQNQTGSTATYKLVIGRAAGTATPRLKYILLQGSGGITAVEYNVSTGGDTVGPTLYGHSATSEGISVAAVPFDNSSVPETFTARGPSVWYFGPVTGTTPAAPIGPTTVNQPDIAATDGGCTTFFGGWSRGCYRFYGTSAATPHAAAVAALILQKSRTQHISMSRSLMKWALQSSAQTVSGGGPKSIGSGLIDAKAAAGKLDYLLTLTIHLYLPTIKR
jgi:hypothetical protein